MKYKVMDGNSAAAHISYMFSDAASIYPITPASTMAEKIDEWASKDIKNLYGSLCFNFVNSRQQAPNPKFLCSSSYVSVLRFKK